MRPTSRAAQVIETLRNHGEMTTYDLHIVSGVPLKQIKEMMPKLVRNEYCHACDWIYRGKQPIKIYRYGAGRSMTLEEYKAYIGKGVKKRQEEKAIAIVNVRPDVAAAWLFNQVAA